MASHPSPRWRKVLRDLALHPRRTLLVVGAIAVGIVGAGSVLTTWSILRDTVTRGYLATNPASATLLTEAVDDSLLEGVRAMAEVADADARRRVEARVRVDGEWLPLQLFVSGDYGTNRIARVEPLRGAWPPTPDAMVVERSSLPLLEGPARVDAPFLATLPVAVGPPTEAGPVRELPVVGVARDAGLAPGWMEHVVYGFATAETLEELGVAPGFDRLRIVVSGTSLEEERVRRVAFEVADAVEATGRTVRDVSVPPPGQHVHAGQMNSLLYVQGLFGLLSFLLAGVLVLDLMTAVLAEQVREIGVMKAVGASTGQVMGVYLGMGLTLGVAASAVGIPAATWIGRAYAGFAAGLLNFHVSDHTLPLGVLGVQLVLGLLLPLAAATGPIYRGTRITPYQALREYGLGTEGSERGGPPTGPRWLGRLIGLRRPALVVLRNAFRRRARLALTVLALATGGAVFLAAMNLRAGIRRTVATAFAGSRFDVSLSLEGSPGADTVESVVRSVVGVAAVETWLRTSASLAYGDGTRSNAFPLTGLPAGTERVDYPLLDGRWLEAEDGNALVVNDLFRRSHPRVSVGDTISLAVEGRSATWIVRGVVRSTFTSPAAYGLRRSVGKVLGEPDRANRAVVLSSRGTPEQGRGLSEALERALDEAGLPARSSSTVEEARTALEDHMLMAAGFLLAMAGLTIVVGGLGLATTMNLAVLERTREIGVLRAVGADQKVVRRMLLAEGVVVGAASCVLAVPLAIPLTLLMGSGFGRIMLNAPVDFVLDPLAVLVWTLLVLAVSLLATLAPAVRATRLGAAEALAYG